MSGICTTALTFIGQCTKPCWGRCAVT